MRAACVAVTDQGPVQPARDRGLVGILVVRACGLRGIGGPLGTAGTGFAGEDCEVVERLSAEASGGVPTRKVIDRTVENQTNLPPRQSLRSGYLQFAALRPGPIGVRRPPRSARAPRRS